SGDLSTEEALQDLLAGTGLDHQYVGDRAVALVTNNSATAAPLTPSAPSARPLGDSRGGNDRADSTQVGEKHSKTSDNSPPTVKGADKPEQKSAALEEIVVTARRREENINTVPVAITALS